MSDYSDFVSKRTKSVAYGKQYDRALLRAIVDFLYSDSPLSIEARQQLATDLQVLYFKQSPQEFREARNRMDWAVLQQARDCLIAEFRAGGSKAPVAEAEEAIAKSYPHIFASADAFNRWMRRHKQKGWDPDKKN